MNITDRLRRQAIAGAKAVEEGFAHGLEGDLFAQVAEDFLIDVFDLEAALVLDAPARAEVSGALVAEMGVEEPAGLGEDRLRVREDFGQADGP